MGHIEELLTSDDVLLIVAQGTRALVGFALAYLRNVAGQSVIAGRRHVTLDSLVVHSDHRRAGLGARRLVEVEKWAKERGAASVELGVRERLCPAEDDHER